MSRLLEGILVIEAGVLMNGAHVGALLADLGASVIKVEHPPRGDYIRDIMGQLAPRESPAHVQLNKNKRSIALDLRSPDGREAFFRLLEMADVFVDGYKPGSADRLGIGYDAQVAVNADIIYCSYNAFGREGPYAAIPAHGRMMNAVAAATPVELGPDGIACPAPGDYLGGTASGGEATAAGAPHAAAHVAAALFQRTRTGAGALIDVAAVDGVIANAWIAAVYNLNMHRIVDTSTLSGQTDASGARTSAKYNFYQTRDKAFVAVALIEHHFWARFCDAVGRPELAGPAAPDVPVDYAHGDRDLGRKLTTIFAERDLAKWIDLAATQRIPIAPANRMQDLLTDPQVTTRNIIIDRPGPRGATFTYVGEAGRVAGQEDFDPTPAPTVGEHSDEILGELGYSPEAIADLRERRIVG
jgi:crotonobetainyl-CoA:carnitine CoA-transferase CaiB-like acyl-CoA transferase